MLLTLDFGSFTADFVEFLDIVVLRDALEAILVVFFEEISLLGLSSFSLVFGLFDIIFTDLEEDFELVVFLEAYAFCCFNIFFVFD